MPRPSILIWDLGKVFVDYVDIHESADFLKRCFVTQESVKNFFTTEGPFFEFERGRISEGEFFEAAAARSNLGYLGTTGEFARDFCESMKMKLDKQMFDFFNSFKVTHGGDTSSWALSNLNSLHYEHFRSRWPGLLSSFSSVFLSFRMGARKPEPEIYSLALNRGGAKAEDCLFIDDKPANVAVAREFGMGALCFTGFCDLKKFLLRFGFTVDRINT